jgi:hypothetical protein
MPMKAKAAAPIAVTASRMTTQRVELAGSPSVVRKLPK